MTAQKTLRRDESHDRESDGWSADEARRDSQAIAPACFKHWCTLPLALALSIGQCHCQPLSAVHESRHPAEVRAVAGGNSLLLNLPSWHFALSLHVRAHDQRRTMIPLS